MNIQANHLTVSINSRNILSDVSMAARGGQMTAITGKSGSGKTTLLNCLGLIHPISAGEIRIDGHNVSAWKERQRTQFWKKHVTFIYQDYGIIDEETVAFNVSLKKGGSTRQVQAALESVGLKGRENDLAVVLSGGEKQRLGIARAMVKNAAIIYADEPTASLDANNRKLVVDLLRRCADNGAAVILATHDERLVDECDTVVKLDKES